MHRKLFRIVNQTQATEVCDRARLADTTCTRLFGLLWEAGLPEGGGLLIQPSSGVHTWGMRFPIDIVALDKDHRVTGAWENIGPWHIRGLSLKTRSVLELPAGQIERSRVCVGDRLTIDETEPAVTSLIAAQARL